MEDGDWTKEFNNEVKMPVIEGVRLKSRLVRDADTMMLIETLIIGPATKPSQINRNLRRPRNLQVVMGVDVEGSQEDAWEDQPMTGERDARLNYLAVDRPDILFSSKEISRGMSRPTNGNWEAIKRLCRYRIWTLRLVISTDGKQCPSPSQSTATRTGPAAERRGSRRLAGALCTADILSRFTQRPRPTLRCQVEKPSTTAW